MAVSKEDLKNVRRDILKNRGSGVNPIVSTDIKTAIGLDPNKSYTATELTNPLSDAYQNFGLAKPPAFISPIKDQQVLHKKRLDSLRLGLYSTMVSGKYGTGKAV